MTNIQKIVSGGQTGVDRAALDVAIFLEIPHGGWCPKGRLSEDGRIPARYQMKEMTSKDYAKRTEQNVIDSDGTLILFWETLRGGTRLTEKLAKRHRRPSLVIDLANVETDPEQVHEWMESENVSVVNVAGPRESSREGIGKIAEQFLIKIFRIETNDKC